MPTNYKKLFAMSISMILLLLSCTNNKLPDDGIEYITIFINPAEDGKAAILIKDKDSIYEITTIINHGRREPVKFRPDYKLEVKYKMGVKQVLIKDQYAIMDGRTYLLNENLGTKLKSIIERDAN